MSRAGHLARIYANGGGPRPNRHAQRRGPLRKIVRVIHVAEQLFDMSYVELECGHRVHSNGAYRARCGRCEKDGK